MPKAGVSLAISYNLSASSAPEAKSFYQGPGINLSKMFMNKSLRAGLNSTYNQNNLNRKKGSPVLSTGLNLGYSPKKTEEGRHSINFNLTMVQRFPSEIQKQKRSEITANLNYAYTF
jgi:hypothetical protein